jgi:hypothetical protein
MRSKLSYQPLDKDKPHPVTPIRAQLPLDTYGLGVMHWKPGQLPTGGYQAVFDYSNSDNVKRSPTSRPEKKRG